jgi:hypothetical protein
MLSWQLASMQEEVREVQEISEEFQEDHARYASSPKHYYFLTIDF